MTPAAMIATLDRALADYGEEAILRRSSWAGTVRSNIDTAVRAHVRGYLPDELVGGIVQGDRRAILSPTPFTDDLPKVGHSLIVGGTSCAIMAVAAIRSGGEVVRIEMQVRG